MTKRPPWRQILKHNSDRYLSWLKENDIEYSSLDLLATQLSQFLIGCIQSEADARKFWDVIPNVRAACNDPATYELPFAALAYAYVHLLQRYARTWVVLRHLTETYVLPLGDQGVRTLDIGTGPAPALYAIDDFYASLGEFAQSNKVPELTIPESRLDCIENSKEMAHFIHHFSEFCHRRGPFGPTFADFSGIDFQSERDFHFRNFNYDTYWDEFTKQYEEWYDPQAASESASRLFRFRFVVFSNFLTLGETVEKFEVELQKLFNDLHSGSVVIVLGGTGDSYIDVYERLSQIATGANMIFDSWDSDELGTLFEQRSAKCIKIAQHNVYEHLENLAGDPSLPKGKEWPDYWTPEPSALARNKFALRVFRYGRWPKATKR